MASSVNISYSIIPQERYTEAVDFFINEFVPREPIARSLKMDLSCKDVREYFSQMAFETLYEGLSIMAVDAKSETIIGAAFNVSLSPVSQFQPIEEYANPQIQKIEEFFRHMYYNDINFSGNRIFTLDGLSVEESHGKRGVASELWRRSEQVARDSGFDIFMVHTSSEYSYKIGVKNGCRVVKTIDITEYPFQGTRVSPDDVGIHKLNRILVKELKV